MTFPSLILIFWCEPHIDSGAKSYAKSRSVNATRSGKSTISTDVDVAEIFATFKWVLAPCNADKPNIKLVRSSDACDNGAVEHLFKDHRGLDTVPGHTPPWQFSMAGKWEVAADNDWEKIGNVAECQWCLNLLGFDGEQVQGDYMVVTPQQLAMMQGQDDLYEQMKRGNRVWQMEPNTQDEYGWLRYPEEYFSGKYEDGETTNIKFSVKTTATTLTSDGNSVDHQRVTSFSAGSAATVLTAATASDVSLLPTGVAGVLTFDLMGIPEVSTTFFGNRCILCTDKVSGQRAHFARPCNHLMYCTRCRPTHDPVQCYLCRARVDSIIVRELPVDNSEDE